MAVDWESWIFQNDKKQGDAKWRRVIRPGCLGMGALFIMLSLFICNVVIYTPRFKESIVWNGAVFRLGPQNCTKEHSTFNVVTTAEALKQGHDDKEDEEKRSACTRASSARQPRDGTQFLPAGIVEPYTDFERKHLWKAPAEDAIPPQNLLAIPVGLKQKATVEKIVKKFPASNFTLMLFHYDGNVDGWADMEWNTRAIHVMSFNQTKWWFAKRFLHPDIVQKYKYLFLWDEDLGVDNFDPSRYLDIMQEEGLEISQPAVHQTSEVHHRLTVRKPDLKAHKRINTSAQGVQCTPEINGPPCTGWVEIMAPVFSREAWRCAWYMIQNDLVHGWGMDYKLGYCAQGVRSEKVGVIDAEYVVHEGIPTLGGPSHKNQQEPGADGEFDQRYEIRKRAGDEMFLFTRRWSRAAANDPNWQDPYAQPVEPKVSLVPEKAPEQKSSGPATVELENPKNGTTN